MVSNKEIIESFLNNDLSYDLNYYLNEPQYIEVMERYLEQENKKLKKRIKNTLLGYVEYQKDDEIKLLESLLDKLVSEVGLLKFENNKLEQQNLVDKEMYNTLLGYVEYQKDDEIKLLESLLDKLAIEVELLEFENNKLKQQNLVNKEIENNKLKQQNLVDKEMYSTLITCTWITIAILIIWTFLIRFN